MKNQWTNYLTGSVKVKIKGRGIERLINECLRKDIVIWQVNKLGQDGVTFYILLKDIKKIRPIVRASECKLYFIGRKGLPFLIKKSLLNSGFLLGAIMFFVIIGLLSNMVWGIEIDGAKPETEYLLKKELQKMGVQRGRLQFMVEDVETIQRNLTNNIQALTWVGVELRGTTYHFQVVEKNEPEEPEFISPRHLVAKKKAVITRMFVEEGQPLVKVNDYVEKGQTLVSGIIGKENRTSIVPAKGDVYGEIWYKSSVSIPLKTTFNVYSGKYKNKHYVSIGSLSIPVWGFQKPEFGNYEKEADVRSVKFLKWTLPISYQKCTLREKESVTRKYSVAEAAEVAKKMARTELQGKLDEDAEIQGEKVLHQSVENGKVKLSLHYQVIENIISPQPIIQGD